MSLAGEAAQSLRQEVMLHELHHRFYNSLQLISAMANRLSRDTLTTDIGKLQDRIAFLAGLHRTLSQPMPTGAGLRSACDDLCIHLVRAFDRDDVAMTISIEPLSLAPDVARCVLLLIVELVTNALKHGTINRPMDIAIALRARARDYELHVANSFDGRPGVVAPRVATQLVGTLGGALDVCADDFFSVRAVIPFAGDDRP